MMTEISYEQLFEGSSLDVGKSLWYFLRARTERYNRLGYYDDDDVDEKGFKSLKKTIEKAKQRAPELLEDPAIWWITKKEEDLNTFIMKTKECREYVQKLKNSSGELSKKIKISESFNINLEIQDLITIIKNFTESEKESINKLLDYIEWIYSKDELAPSILFCKNPWGDTRRADRSIRILTPRIQDDEKKVKICTLIALGLAWRLGERIPSTLYDFDNGPTMRDRLYYAKHIVIQELALYFELIRNSLDRVLNISENYQLQLSLLNSDDFWKKFILKARGHTENKLWDFKLSFSMFHVSKSQEKKKQQIDFCEQIAGYGNNQGGVLIVGIKDQFPRAIKGVPDIEDRMNTCVSVINRRIKYTKNVCFLKEIILKDDNDVSRRCFVIVIPQTRKPLSVKKGNDAYSYPIRLETGLERWYPGDIEERKIEIEKDNFNFIIEIQKYSNT